MKFTENLVANSISDLRAEINVVILQFPEKMRPGFDFDGTFESIRLGVENLRKRLGSDRADQIQDMVAQAKRHFEVCEYRLGGPLLQDVTMAIMTRQPFAYPKHLYRWPLDPSLPELSEADLLNREP